MRRPVGLYVVCLLMLASSGLTLWMAAKLLGPAGLMPQTISNLIPLAKLLGPDAAVILLRATASREAIIAQAAITVVLAVGLFFKQPWARWLTVAFYTIIPCLRIFIWIAFIREHGLETSSTPITLGTIVSLAIVIYLLRPKVGRLFHKQQAGLQSAGAS